MQQLAVVLLLAIHLLCVNVASTGPLVAAWLDWREGRGDQLAGKVGRQLTWASLSLLIAGTVVGLLVGVLLWDDAYRDVLRRFDRRVYFAVWELVFSLLLLAMTGSWWGLRCSGQLLERGLRMLLQVAASTNLLYHFPPLLILVSDTSAGWIDAPAVIDATQFRTLILTGSVLSRTIHHWLASLAVAGIATMACALWSGDDGNGRLVIFGGRLALLPTILQLPVGVWLVSQLPLAAQRQLLGRDLSATVLLGVAVLLSLWLLHLLSAAALGDTTPRTTRRSMAVAFAIVLLMTGVTVRMSG